MKNSTVKYCENCYSKIRCLKDVIIGTCSLRHTNIFKIVFDHVFILFCCISCVVGLYLGMVTDKCFLFLFFLVNGNFDGQQITKPIEFLSTHILKKMKGKKEKTHFEKKSGLCRFEMTDSNTFFSQCRSISVKLNHYNVK